MPLFVELETSRHQQPLTHCIVLLPWLFKMDMILFLWLTILGVMAILVFAGVFILLVPAIEESEEAGRI